MPARSDVGADGWAWAIEAAHARQTRIARIVAFIAVSQSFRVPIGSFGHAVGVRITARSNTLLRSVGGIKTQPPVVHLDDDWLNVDRLIEEIRYGNRDAARLPRLFPAAAELIACWFPSRGWSSRRPP